MAVLSMGVLVAGFDLIVIDPMKSCADFRWAQPWTLAMAPDLPTGSAAMRWVIGEVDRRKNSQLEAWCPQLPRTARKHSTQSRSW
jgi:hypothetical protein